MNSGDRVMLTYLGQSVEATLVLISANGHSLLLQFPGALGEHLGAMAVLRTDGIYRSITTDEEVTITPGRMQ